MRAISQERFGGTEVLQLTDLKDPEPDPTEIRVRVRAAGVNPVDIGTRRGGGVSELVGALPFVLGWEASGVVDAVAPGVTRFAVGDEVFGLTRFPHRAGTHAELVTGPSRHFAPKPAGLDHPAAGALALAGLTAWQVLVDTAHVQPGQRVLVHGAGGGVGHLAAQIALALGASVVGTANPAKHDALRRLGLDDLLDHATADLSTVVDGVDVVVDTMGPDTAHRSLDVLRPGGLLVYVPSDVLPDGLEDEAAARGVRASSFLVEPDHAGLARLAALADSGKLQVLLHATFPLEDAAAAHDLVENGRPLGKVALTM